MTQRSVPWFYSRRKLAGPMLLLCLPMVAGCGNEFEIASARGIVRLDGKPAAGGHVLFLPVGGGQKAIGRIGPDGAFVLTSYREGDGAQVGQHQIAIVRAVATRGTKPASYRCDDAHRVEVVADKDNEFTLNVDSRHGWKAIAAD
jgi:hypothetical protein